MSAYKHALIVDEIASEQHLAEAAKVLDRCEGVVMLRGVVALAALLVFTACRSDSHRCAEEFKVLVENAAYALAESKLAAHLPLRLRQWMVVDGRGPGVVRLWPEN